jgi:hypothetical protein
LHLIIIPGLIVAHRVGGGGATAKVHMRLLSRRLNFPVDTPIEKLKKKISTFEIFFHFLLGNFKKKKKKKSLGVQGVTCGWRPKGRKSGSEL